MLAVSSGSGCDKRDEETRVMFSSMRPLFDDSVVSWNSYRRRIGVLSDRDQFRLPDFLIISPAKTGTSWIARNLMCHPEIYIPPEKELHYFDCWWKSQPLESYLAHFHDAQTCICGEATPSYALLPSNAIRELHRLNPKLKLIFVLREPIARAWSHLKHSFVYREAGFAACTATDFRKLSPEDIFRASIHGLVLGSGDYAEILRRWMSVFPREQIFVDFFENSVADPEIFYRKLMRFLGVASDVDLSSYPLNEAVNKSLLESNISPETQALLADIYREKARHARELVHDQFGLDAPWPECTPASELSPVWLRDEGERQLWYWKGKFLALQASDDTGGEDILPLVAETRLQGRIDKREYLEDFRWIHDDKNERVLNLREVADRRLASLLGDLMPGVVNGVPIIVEEYREFNIFQVWGRTCVARQSAGEIALSTPLSLDVLLLRMSPRDFFLCDGIQAARSKIDIIWAGEPRSR